MSRLAGIVLYGFLGLSGVYAGLLNEWTFETVPSGQPLSAATNSAISNPSLAHFGAGFGTTVYTTNRVLTCVGQDSGSVGVWTNGALLDAALPSTSSGVYYLRYDLAYSLTNSLNNSGTLLGVYFTDSTTNKVAGLMLGYDKGNLVSAAPTNRPLTSITNGLPLSGTLTAIAEVNLSNHTAKVWYSLTGSSAFNTNTPAYTRIITFNSIANLRFHATGDFRPVGSTDSASVDNVRMASTWEDIVRPAPNFTAGPIIEVVSITVTNPSGTAGTDIGETNTVAVVIRNLNAPANNVMSALSTASNPEYFTIQTDNIPIVLEYGQYVTNTFFLTAKTNALSGLYTFNVSVAADGSVQTNTTFGLTVGSSISYLANSITEFTNLFGGFANGRYEPGEAINITVYSTNDGANAVSNIINSLSADSAYFTISNLTSTGYANMAVGRATSTVYRVVINAATPQGTNWFSVTNRAGAKVWTDSFPVTIFQQGLPAVSPASISMNMLPGAAATNTQIVVTNSGNAALTFTMTDNGSWRPFYAVTLGTRGSLDFVAANTVIALKDSNTNSINIEAANAGVSSATNIGFSFPFYGTTYSNFYVTADGYIGLSNTTNVPWISADRIPYPTTNGAALIAPFWGTLNSPAGSIKTIRKDAYLVISYTGVSKESGAVNLQFQVALFTNGCIDLRYNNITGITNSYGLTNVTIGIQGSTTDYTNLTVAPVNGTSIRLVPQQDQWVAYTPSQNVTVNPLGSQVITFRADASGRMAGSGTNFNAWFSWSTGGSNVVAVSANILAATPGYSAVSSLSFTGSSEQVTSVPFIITNSGTGPLNFTISNSISSSAGYINNTNSAYSWIDISATGSNIVLIDPSSSPYITAEDEGFSAMIPLKFTFPFYGGSYTQFSVSVNGALRLDTTGRVVALGRLDSPNSLMPVQMIAPYWGDLVKDENATIKYLSTSEQLVITWENIRQYGIGCGSNLTFQAILKPSGDITFQYKKLEGRGWPNTTIGLRDTSARIRQADIRQSGDWSVSTSSVSGSVYTQYVDAVSSRAVQFPPAQIQVIGYTPSSGSISAASNAVIIITGDASNQSAGTNSVVTNVTLTISHNASGGPASLSVTFTATNSQESAFVRAAASEVFMTDEQKTFGTAAFTPVIRHDPAIGTLLSWTPPEDGAQRTYIIYCTSDLTIPFDQWTEIATVTRGTSYLDTNEIRLAEPVIYYRVSVAVP